MAAHWARTHAESLVTFILCVAGILAICAMAGNFS